MRHPDFDNLIANATRAVVSDADADFIAKVTAGVMADSVWSNLSWLDAKTAEGSLAQGLAQKAAGLAKALQAASSNVQPASPKQAGNDAQSIAAAFGMTMEQWRSTPPEAKTRLAAALADKQAEAQHQAAGIENLKAKIDAGTATPAQKLEYARLTEEPGPTKAQRRDPRFIQAQRERASTAELLKMLRGHEQIYASGQYPQVMRDDHKKHADRLRAIIAEREAS